jgi:hypothetical protein
MLYIILFAASWISFIIALERFPFGSIQNTIMFFLAGMTMFLAVGAFVTYQGATTNQNLYFYFFDDIYLIVCFIFPAIGWVYRLTGKLS